MMVSELLWVGRGPDEPIFGKIVPCSSPHQAYDEMKKMNTVVVPTTDMARETLLLLGVGEAWAAYATQGTVVERDVDIDL